MKTEKNIGVCRFFKGFFSTLLLLMFLTKSAFALEITNYTTSISGIFHNVTVAFDDLDKSAWVRCIIKMNDKPVGMETQFINGVETIEIMISGGALKTKVYCSEKK